MGRSITKPSMISSSPRRPASGSPKSLRMALTSLSSGAASSRPLSQWPFCQLAPSPQTVPSMGKAGKGRASQAHNAISPRASMRRVPPTLSGFARGLKRGDAGSNTPICASSALSSIRSSRCPFENGGNAFSDDLGSGKTLGLFAPLSTAGQPVSVSQTGFAPGTQAVATPSSAPPTRSICGFRHQLAMSLAR